MANPTTTHVIEIETGIGEPAFIPLSMGQELQPISVGKKGMWRIESPRVLDVHAFVYFDGTSLFLQSADEANAASVDGYRVGKAWTELHAPCKIEVGNARLRYRSLLAPGADADNQPTMMAPAPPVQAPPGGPGGPPRPGASMPAAGAPPPPQPGQSRPMMQGAPPPAAPSAPMMFPKAERPFKPGEFSSGPDLDESTRIAPLDATGAGRVASGSHPRPAAGQPADERSMGPGMMMGPGPMQGASGQYGAMNNMQGPPGMMGPPPAMGSQPGGGIPPGLGSQPGGSMQPMGYPQQGYSGYPNGGNSGQFNMQPNMPQIPGPPGMPQGQLGPSMAPGGYGSMTPQGGMQQPGGPPQTPMQEFVAKLKANSIPKIIAGVLFVIGGILYLAEDDEPVQPKKKITASIDGGVDGGQVTANGGSSSTGTAPTSPPVMTAPAVTTAAPAWPAGVPCPPPNWPPNTPLPCTPNAAGGTPDKNPPDKNPKDGASKSEPRDAGAPLPAGTKTLERQAVDHVAAGETAKAAAAYEELVKRDPNNKVYAEAARILRAKLDGGVPGQ